MSTDYRPAISVAAGETRITVRLVPRAATSGVAGLQGTAVKLRVTAPPVDGKANDAALRLLAAALGVRPGDLRIVSGRRARTKVVAVSGLDPSTAARRLAGA